MAGLTKEGNDMSAPNFCCTLTFSSRSKKINIFSLIWREKTHLANLVEDCNVEVTLVGLLQMSETGLALTTRHSLNVIGTREVHELAVSVQYFQSFRHSRKDRYFVDRNRQFVDLPRMAELSGVCCRCSQRW